ncbi:MAG TPA: hypothetical protein VMV07_13820 [Streptosporangiaceae bacterium]|nr:hypothetical protein [Streptosporangiaceae bacterium]
MIVAAALCPAPPLLARELTGGDPALPELRDACGEVTRRLLEAEPEAIAVVGAAPQTRLWDPASRLDLSVFAPAARVPPGTPGLPPSLGLGVLLLDQAGYTGRRILQAVGQEEPTAACVELGERLAQPAERIALLVMADGSARRSRRAPGYFDERSADFDAAVERAIRAGDLDALAAVDPGLARELMATGRPAWQVLSGAMRGLRPAADVLYAGDPFGVAYLVAALRTTAP